VNLVRIGFVLGLLAACASGHYATVDPGHAAFVIPHHIAEGTGEGSDLPEDAGPPPTFPPAPPLLAGSAPDPEPLHTADQWKYALLYQAGSVSVDSVEKRILPKPISTPRRMGRFALELWIGHELIDRVRFDFPLIAAEEAPGVTRRPLHDPPSLGPHAIARISVLVPASTRATRLLLIDRATEKSQLLPWPPDREPSSVPQDDDGSAALVPSIDVAPQPSPTIH
jgi:hypothetical protein